MIISPDQLSASVAKFSRLSEVGEVDLIALAVAMTEVGKTKPIGKVLKYLSRSGLGLTYFAVPLCRCGRPDCISRDFGVIGYLEGYFPGSTSTDGILRPLLQFELVEEGVKR